MILGERSEMQIGPEQLYARARHYDPTLGRFISEDPIGFGGGDKNLNRYVGNHPTDATDPSGLAEWRLDLTDHGGAHIQLGNERWDAITGNPVKHLGHTPEPLTARQWEQLRQQGIWDRIMKNVPENQLQSVIQEMLTKEVRDKLAEKGARALSKKAAKSVAKEIVKRSPLAVFFLVCAADEVRADTQERGILFAATNQVFPASLFEEIYSSASHGVSDWIWDDWLGISVKQKARQQRMNRLINGQ